MQCGDLSRYRETELKTNLRNWGPAVGYYKKAAAFNPADGKAYNQLAVIALSDRDHLRAVYYLYQALCVETPFPQAPGNLDLEFKKLRAKSNQGKPIAENSEVFKGSHHLYEQFLLFHARCWDMKSADQDVQQTEILRLIADEVREQPDATILRKFSLINIAAEKCAGDRVSGRCQPPILQSSVCLTVGPGDASAFRLFQILQSFNVKVFSLLLKLVLDELRQPAGDANHLATRSLDEVPPITRRCLPHLRLYSGWLLTTVQLLMANTELASHMQQLWCLYARTLNALLQFVPPTQSDVQYLLKEDGETLGFSGFSPFVRNKRFYRSSQLKPMYTEASFGPQIPDKEMLFRIREILRDAMLLFRDVSRSTLVIQPS